MPACDQQDLFAYLLRLGDSGLVLGQRLSEWVGKAPMLEEEMALANMALDLVGQSRMFLAYAAQVEGKGRTEDQLAMHRDVHEFANVLLVEQPNGDFAHSMVRQYFYASFAGRLCDSLQHSTDRQLAGIAAKAVKEFRYHTRHAGLWMVRLGDGTDESHDRMTRALQDLWPYTGELFDMDELDRRMLKAGIGVDLQGLRKSWREDLDTVLNEAGLPLPAEDAWMHGGGRAGRHSEHLGHLLATMQFLPRAYPDAGW
jgi:ring-1,2-phenylacetyl-CoA epoxidase subunit PaaC